MTAIVVPFRGGSGKRRLDAPAGVRKRLALAMLGDVTAACTATWPTLVVTSDPDAQELVAELGAEHVEDRGGGQGAAVAAALETMPAMPLLVVNADVPCVVPRDLRTLQSPAELGALALVEAADGTTNALALPRPAVFAALYGPGSAERFLARGRAAGLDALSMAIPNLRDDVDTIDDLERLVRRAGPRTQSALGLLSVR